MEGSKFDERNPVFVTQGPGVPPSLAGVSHAVAIGSICHTGGQLAIDPHGQLIHGSAREQAKLAFKNLLAVLAAAGCTKTDILFIDIALTDMGELPAANAEFHLIFSDSPRPARAVAEVSALPLGAKIRVHALAVRNQSNGSLGDVAQCKFPKREPL